MNIISLLKFAHSILLTYISPSVGTEVFFQWNNYLQFKFFVADGARKYLYNYFKIILAIIIHSCSNSVFLFSLLTIPPRFQPFHHSHSSLLPHPLSSLPFSLSPYLTPSPSLLHSLSHPPSLSLPSSPSLSYPPSLLAVHCSDPLHPRHGRVTFVRPVMFGTVATYSCNAQHGLVGPATRVCLANGQWSVQAPTCRRK